MFVDSFIKTAGIGSAAGTAIGKAVKGATSVNKLVGGAAGKMVGATHAGARRAKKFFGTKAKETAEAASTAYEKQVRPGRARGAGLAKVRKLKKTEEATKTNLRAAAGKVQPSDVAKAKTEAEKRLARMKAGRPGFAAKHPLITAGLAYGGARAVFGGDDKQDAGGPYVEVNR